jgi:quercetin dioxygenase-like cupin family protein
MGGLPARTVGSKPHVPVTATSFRVTGSQPCSGRFAMMKIPTEVGRVTGARMRPRPEVRVARKVLLFDLKTEAEALKAEPPWKAHGHNAKTLVRRGDSRIVLTALKKDAHVHQHKHSASVSIQAEKGRVQVHLLDDVMELLPGMILSVAPDIAHDIEAMEESLLLLTFAAPN